MKITKISLANLVKAQQEWERKKMGDNESYHIINSVVCCKKERSSKNFIRAIEHKNRVQGIIACTFEKDHIIIDYLASAPWNVYGKANRLNGCGTKLINYIYKRAIADSKIKYIELFSQHNAIGFYEKLGFAEKNGSMRISRSNIERVLEGGK
jgi:hypothetical protein